MNITVENLKGRLKGVDMLDGFSAGFPPGVTAVVGPEGSGKSALLAMLAGRLRPEAGDILFNGASVLRPKRRLPESVGYLPAKAEYPLHNTVERTLLRQAAAMGLGRGYARERAEASMRLLGLSAYSDIRLSDCTQDVSRRTAIAAALLPDPEVLLMDEPAAGLTPTEQMRLSAIFAGYPRGRTVIYATADPSHAETGPDWVVFVGEGRSLLCAPRERLVACLRGRVWRLAAPQEDAWQIRLEHVVTDQQKVLRGLRMRIVSDSPPPYGGPAVPEEPELRDVYAWCLSRGPEQIGRWLDELSYSERMEHQDDHTESHIS